MLPARQFLARPLSPLAIFILVGSAASGALYAYAAGEDVNWDWQNYHEYGGFTLLHGRFDTDVAPGGFQSYLNPLVYVLPYVLRHGLPAPVGALLLGALHGLTLALIYWATRLLVGRDAGRVPALAAMLIAALSPMALSEVGASFSDIVTAVPIITGVTLLLSAEAHWRRLMISGLLIGAATGLKLTNAAFLIGAGLCLVLTARPLAAMVVYGLGATMGAVATGGFWALKMARDFGSPLFPFYNSLFRSPEAPAESIIDTRFMPQGLLDALAYPFYWLVGLHPSNEWPFRDPRFALVIVLLAMVALVAAVRRRAVLTRRDVQLLVFFWTGYALWMLAFSIQRYLIPLELLAAPLIVLLTHRLVMAIAPAQPLRWQHHAVTLTTALAVALWSQPCDWGRRPWSDPWRPQLAQALTTPATFLLLQKPLGYIVPELPAGSRAYQLAELMLAIVPGGVLDRRIKAGLADPLPGGVWAVYYAESRADNPPRLDYLDNYGLMPDPARACAQIAGADRALIKVCPLLPRAGGATPGANQAVSSDMRVP